MTKETKLELLLDQYDKKKEEIAEKYTEKFNNLKANNAGYVSTQEFLEIGAWKVQKINELRHWLVCEINKIIIAELG